MHCLEGFTMKPSLRKFLPRIILCLSCDLSARHISTSKSLDAISMVVLITGRSVSCPPVSLILLHLSIGLSNHLPFSSSLNLILLSGTDSIISISAA